MKIIINFELFKRLLIPLLILVTILIFLLSFTIIKTRKELKK